ncbi:hypothetical protein [Methylobacterium aquaticum]|nr:hypothetical protein [Methylobacterium aquaticum]
MPSPVTKTVYDDRSGTTAHVAHAPSTRACVVYVREFGLRLE